MIVEQETFLILFFFFNNKLLLLLYFQRLVPCLVHIRHTPVFLPGEFHGKRSLLGYSPWGHKQSDMAEQLKHTNKFRREADLPGELKILDKGQSKM